MTDQRSLRPARVRVPASTSNLGAGFDCIGLALDRCLVADYEPGPGALRVERSGTLASFEAPAADDHLASAFCAELARRGRGPATGVLRADSAIPLARGLGSSAAARTAGLLLACTAAGGSVDRTALFRAVAAAEGHADNAAPAVYGGLVAVARSPAGEQHVIALPLADKVGFAFAAPGRGLGTAEARSVLPERIPRERAVTALGRIVALTRGLAVADAELLRVGCADELHVPYRLPLIPGADAALAAARSAGAWAATISGGGSGLVAVCAPDRADAVAAAMAAAFAASSADREPLAFAVRPEPRGAVAEGAV